MTAPIGRRPYGPDDSDTAPVEEVTTLTHPSGATYTLTDDDAERMACERVGEPGHASCGVHPCCGWPRFLVCPDDPRVLAEAGDRRG